MQQIERYGVIALVFLLVTIVAVSFWGDNKSPGFWSRLTGKSKKEEVAKTEAPPATAEQALLTEAPLNPVPAPLAQPVSAPTTGLGGAPVDPLARGLDGQPLQQPAPGTLSTPPAGGIANAPLELAPLQPAVHAPLGTPPSNEYVVQKGDSMALIARRTLGSEQRWTEIQALNNGLQPKSLKVGMKLALPADAKAAPARTASTPNTAGAGSTKTAAAKSTPPKPGATKSSGGNRYTVQKGDTLYSIASKKCGSKSKIKEILALNPGLDARNLVVGRSIVLPGGGASSERAPLVATASTSDRSGKPRVR